MASATPINKLDTLQSIELAEGVDIQLRTAGLLPRAWAFLIDAGIRIMLFFLVMMALGLVGLMVDAELPAGMFLLIVFLIEWGYPTLYEAGRRGASPGKRMLGLRVVRESGAPISFGQSILRNLMRAADMLPFAYGFAMVSCLFTRKFQRLGDLVAGTLVVYADTRTRKAPEIQLLIKPKPPRLALHREEQQAVTEFLERASLWSDSRRVELADELQELTGERGERAVGEVFAIGQWLRESRGGDS